MKLKALVGVLAVAGLAMPGIASATNGMFSHGYGMKAKGMGGAATAMAVDAFGGANNPASMVFVGDRLDVGVDWFRPIRSADRAGSMDSASAPIAPRPPGYYGATDPGSMGSMANGHADSGSEDFAIPEFGFNMMMGDKMSFGVTVYGNGGMNTDYTGGEIAGGTLNMLGGSDRLGVDLIHLIIAPTFAYKLTEQHSLGVSPLIGYQRFKLEGTSGFAAMSNDPNHMYHQGYDNSLGFGVRLGYMGKLNNMVSVGAAYSTKVKMSAFGKYSGMFAEQGDLDIPENWNVGIAIKPIPSTTIALDYQRINYSGVKAIGNASTNIFNCTLAGGTDPSACIGGSNGPGFGWGDVDVTKLGVEYAYNEKLTLRAGYSHNTNPITSRDVTFNILAPGVITDHYTLGFTYGLGHDAEITMSYMHAQENSVSGASLFSAFGIAPSATETIKMHQDSLGIAYGVKF